MTKTRDIVLADRTFAVPLLPLRYNRVIYPLCRDLSEIEGEDTFFARLESKGGTPDAVRDNEWEKLTEIAFHAACAADKDMARDDFENMAITPPQLIDAFFIVRLQTGGWIAGNEAPPPPPDDDAHEAGDTQTGEA